MATTDHPLILDLGKVRDTVQSVDDLGLVAGNSSVINNKWEGAKSLKIFGHVGGIFLVSGPDSDPDTGWSWDWTGSISQTFVAFPSGLSIPAHVVPWRGMRKVSVDGNWVEYPCEGLAYVSSPGVTIRTGWDSTLGEALSPSEQSPITLDWVVIGAALFVS